MHGALVLVTNGLNPRQSPSAAPLKPMAFQMDPKITSLCKSILSCRAGQTGPTSTSPRTDGNDACPVTPSQTLRGTQRSRIQDIDVFEDHIAVYERTMRG